MKADPRTPPDFAHLPKYLIASPDGRVGGGSGYVIHCHYPRFIMSVNADQGSGLPLWLDKPGRPGAEGPSPLDTALVLEATDFFKTAVQGGG